MSQELENPQAFPRNIANKEFEGMTLRDYFAAKAMQGQVSNQPRLEALNTAAGGEKTVLAWLAESSYEIADALLKEREK